MSATTDRNTTNLIEWTTEFSVGVVVLDEQHKRMIAVINSLARQSGTTVDSEVVSEALTRMAEYSNIHFTEEEWLLREYGYPDLAAHKAEHKEYIERMVKFCDATSLRVDSVPDRLLHFLKEWWVKHILVEDRKYKEFFEAQGVR